jgi:hypothetical protein
MKATALTQMRIRCPQRSWCDKVSTDSLGEVIDDRDRCQRQVGEPSVPELGFRADQNLGPLWSNVEFRQPSQRSLSKHFRQHVRRG